MGKACHGDTINVTPGDGQGPDESLSVPVQIRNLLARRILDNTSSWLCPDECPGGYRRGPDTASQVIEDCGSKMRFGTSLRLRWDRSNRGGDGEGGAGVCAALEEVVPLRLNMDGTLLVSGLCVSVCAGVCIYIYVVCIYICWWCIVMNDFKYMDRLDM